MSGSQGYLLRMPVLGWVVIVRLNLSDLGSQSTLFKSVDSCISYSLRMWNANPIHPHISVGEADFLQ